MCAALDTLTGSGDVVRARQSRSRWTAVVPVKRTERAKTRLHPDAHRRRQLAEAFALDTVAALTACAAVSRVLVVTDDEHVTAAVADREGVAVEPDLPRAGLNAALEHGAAFARRRSPGDGVVMVSSDLPALRPAELALVLDEASGAPAAFVCDTAGVGTTVLTCAPGQLIVPRFGERSRAAHRRVALEIARVDIPSVRRDVDTWVDLWDAQRLGVGPATLAALG